MDPVKTFHWTNDAGTADEGFLVVHPDGSIGVNVADDWYNGKIDRATARDFCRELARRLELTGRAVKP